MKGKIVYTLITLTILICLSFMLAGCKSNKTFKLNKIIYDKDSKNPITYNINDKETIILFEEKIKEVGDKIILKKNKLIFNGDKTKIHDGSFWYAKDDNTIIGFDDTRLMASYAGFRLFENEIHIYVHFYTDEESRVFLNFIYHN